MDIEISVNDIVLKQTCGACPEQYDAMYHGVQVGYLRLRHGEFSVSCPDSRWACGEIPAETVMYANPNGDGEFYDDEREHYLNEAKVNIVKWLTKDDNRNYKNIIMDSF